MDCRALGPVGAGRGNQVTARAEAKNDPASPIAERPIIDNDLLHEADTSMLFDDAKKAAAEIAPEIQQL